MKYTSKKMPESVVELEAVLSHQEFLDFYQPVFNHALEHVELKGFRPGTAPKDLAEKAVDKEKVFHEAASEAVRNTLKKIMQENDWQFIDQPNIEISETNPQADIGLKFKATLSVFPEVKLGNYQKIAKKNLKDEKEVSVDDEEIKKSIDYVLNSRAKLTRVNREAKKGDVADIHFSGFIEGPVRSSPPIGSSGPRLRAGATSNGMDSGINGHDQFILGEGKFIPGFEDNIIGHKEKDKFDFSVNFPEDYWKEDLKNKKVDFKVEVHGVFERQLPELNDEFVKGIGKFENVESFRKNVREGLLQEKKSKERERIRLKILEEIIKDSKIELPKVMVERTLDNMVEEYKHYSQKLNKIKQEDDADLKKRLEERAKNSVSTNLVLYQISKEQNLEPASEEVEKGVNDFLNHSRLSGQPADKIDPGQLYDYIYDELKNKKVFEYLESLK